jgi:hypothetical protein
MSAPSEFNVTIRDLVGHTITILSTPYTTVFFLINQFREVILNKNKNKRIILTSEKGPLKRGTLKKNGIRDTITLMVVYDKNTACIQPEPIADYLHEWIDYEFITFKGPLDDDLGTKTHLADCTDLIAEHNGWIMDQEYLFFVTAAPLQDPISFPSEQFDEMIHYEPLTNRDSPLSITLFPDGVGEDSTKELMNLTPFSSVKGTLHRITLTLTKTITKTITKTLKINKYVFKYQFDVIIQGPIDIHDDRGMIISSLDAPTQCKIRYDHIVRCDEMEQPDLPDKTIVDIAIPDNYQGGKRSIRSKRAKKTKKRKTRRAKKQRVRP